MYKVFCNNCRLSRWVELNHIISDEQYGFRARRSCAGQLLSLTFIVQARISAKKDTHAAFVDFSKAFDEIDRQKVSQKLNTIGVSGHFIQVLRALYQNEQCCVSVNSVKSRWFLVAVGLKQGCMLSSLLFNLYTSDLEMVIKQTGEGVMCDNFRVHILSYADKTCFLAESERDLQQMLQTLATWCENWSLVLNTAKTQAVHFRNRKSSGCAFQFNITVLSWIYLSL